jgi:hypothetical protein
MVSRYSASLEMMPNPSKLGYARDKEEVRL